MSTPASEIILYSGVPLDNTYRNVVKGGITKDTLSAYKYYTWFSQTYCRIVGQYNNKVRIDNGTHFSDYFMNTNYISIENLSGIVIFGFITDILYINDNVTEITYEIDVFHTYYENFSFYPCLVERATPDSTINAQNFSLSDYMENGEYETLYSATWTPLGQNLTLVCFFAPAKGREYGDNPPLDDTGIMSGYLTGCKVIGFTAYPTTSSEIDNMRNMLNHLYKRGLQCIMATIMPTVLYTTYNAKFNASLSSSDISNIVAFLNSLVNSNILNGVNFKNKKTATYPYTYLEVSNNLGTVKQYAWEGWGYGTPQFEVQGVSIPTPTITLVPRNYFGKTYDYENSITVEGYPNMPVQGDTIGSWISQNATSSAIKGLGSVASGAVTGAMVGGGPIGALIGGLVGGTMSAFDYASNFEKAFNSPSQMTSSTGSGSILSLPTTLQGFTFRAKSLKTSNIESIDNFFTRFGVSENKLELPPLNRTVRGNYNYIKTKGCTIKCKSGKGIPVWAERKICDIHDNGVTYWSRLSNVGNYS